MDEAISKQSAIDALRRLYIENPQIDNDFVYDMALDQADDAIKQLPPIQPEPHWIPCGERLPEEEGFYLVTLEHDYGAETNIRFFQFENGKRYWSLWGNENITAWMPKPEAYRGE